MSSTPASPQAARSPQLPELAGPADDLDPYSGMTRPQIGRIPSRRDHDPDLPANVVRTDAQGCARCHGIPPLLLASLQAALAQAQSEAETATVKAGARL
jgi:hypothetical protein